MIAEAKHITDLTREDLKSIARVVNIRPGEGLNIRRDGDALVVEIDRDKLRAMLSFCR